MAWDKEGARIPRLVLEVARGLAKRFSRTCPNLDKLVDVVVGSGVEGAPRECRQELRDLLLAVEAGLAWHPPPMLDEPIERVLRWALGALYKASTAEVYASKRARAFVAARGFWTRRIVERLLSDYSAIRGLSIVVSDVRVRIGWVSIPKLLRCPRCGSIPQHRYELVGDELLLEVACRCGFHLSLRAEPPLASRL